MLIASRAGAQMMTRYFSGLLFGRHLSKTGGGLRAPDGWGGAPVFSSGARKKSGCLHKALRVGHFW